MTNTTVTETIAKLSANGRKLIEAVPGMDFFDDGYRAGSGNWGSNMAAQVDFKKGSFSGVMNRLVKMGLWEVSEGDAADDSMWFALTDLGAAVVREVNGIDEDGNPVCKCAASYLDSSIHEEGCPKYSASEQVEEPEVEPVREPETEQVEVTSKVGSKWTYLYAADGTLIAELKNTDLELVGAWFRSAGLA